jgi:N4-gp56 family major capsid protein
MATGNITTTTVDAFLPEIWSQEIILAATNKSVFEPLVRRDFDGDINAAGDVVHVPLFSAVTTGTKEANTEVTLTNYTESTKDISIDQHKYFAFRVEDIANVQSSPNLIQGYSAQGAKAIAKVEDVSIASLAINAAITQNVGATTSAGAYTDITDAVIRNAIQLLDEAEAPEEDRYLVISPAQKNAMLGIAKFVEADKLGSDVVITKGLFGQIYGVQVYISNNLPDVASVASSSGASAIVGRKTCIMFHKEAFALARQIAPRIQSAYNLTHLATEVVGDILYGVGVLVPTFAVQVRCTDES